MQHMRDAEKLYVCVREREREREGVEVGGGERTMANDVSRSPANLTS